MSRIWIIEAAGKVKTLRRVLAEAGHPSDRVLATHGRLYDLADDLHEVSKDILKDLNTIEWAPLRKDQITQLMELTRGASELVLATDADLEGELIAHHFIKAFARPGMAISRAYLMGFTADHIKTALDSKKSIDSSRVFAAIARRLFDRHLGYQLVSEEDHFRMSMGRVVSPLIQSLLEKPPITTRIECELLDGWKAIFSLPSHLGSQAQVLCSILSDLPETRPDVDRIEALVDEKKPLTGPEAIVLCSNELKNPIVDIVSALQSNYMEGKLSYPRTDSRRMGEISTKWARRMAEAKGLPFSDEHLAARRQETLERSFDAHEALVPLTDSMVAKGISHQHLNINDAVLAVISEHTASIGKPPTPLNLEYGTFGNDESARRWKSVARTFLPYLSLERTRSEGGAIIPSIRGSLARPPAFSSGRVKMWRDDPTLTAAKRMIELGLGRPSTISQIADKAAKNYLNEHGEINGRGRLMLHKVNERCPLLLKEGIAKKVEQSLIDSDRHKSVADRLSVAWSILNQKPLREKTDVAPSPMPPTPVDSPKVMMESAKDVSSEPKIDSPSFD